MQPRESSRHRKLALRPARASDALLLERWRSEPSVRRHQPLGAVSAAQLGAELGGQRIGDLYRGRGEKFQWIIRCCDEPAGWITLVVANWEHGLAEIGYALATRFQNQGLMAPALDLLLGDLFHNSRLERLEARCSVDNLASQRVLDRVGFRREGRLRGYFVLHGRRVDNYLYALLRDDWMARPPTR